jgi:hypothetical protein
LAGLASFIWLAVKDLAKLWRKPKLSITFKSDRDLRVVKYEAEGWSRKFVTLHVQNNGKETAQRCIALMNIGKKPLVPNIIEDQYPLHWASRSLTNLTTGAEPIDIGRSELARLDVLFTQAGQAVPGCWVAVPFALSGNLGVNQMYLLPGEYEFEVVVSCEDGRRSRSKFKLVSPSKWDELHVHQL